MLLYVFLLLLAIHYVLLIFGIERRKGGYILLAIMIILVLEFSAAYVIQIPVIATNSQNTSDVRVFVRGIQDPITAFFLLMQEIMDIIIYGTLTRWGLNFHNRGWW